MQEHRLKPMLPAGLGGAGEEGGDFDDGVGELAHGADEGLDEMWVELGAGAALEFREGLIGGAGFFVAAVAGDGVVGIGDGDYAGGERGIFCRKGFWGS